MAEVGEYISKAPEVIAQWESGDAWPTYRQLENLADGLFHRPVALFFFPEPPDEPPTEEEFRTLPDFDVEHLDADTRYAIRVARAYQQSLRELTGGVNSAARKVWRDLRFTQSSDVVTAANELRSYLDVSLDRQRAWRSTADAMAGWRARIEDVGVYVFKRSFKQREISGFCLTDAEFPVIMVNNSTAFSRQVFTLFHELAHLLYGVNSITTVDGRFVDHMEGASKSIEVSCNQFAAEFLVPAAAFPWDAVDRRNPVASVADISRRFNVSREVILRRIMDRGWVNPETYRSCVREWAAEAESGRSGEGGNYYNTQAAYLGDSYLRLAFSRHRAGLISTSDLSEHLGVKARNLSKLEDRVASRI
ncbi:MAG: XRE family transcriptional regulator [Coriobacteriia bacterium]